MIACIRHHISLSREKCRSCSMGGEEQNSEKATYEIFLEILC